MFRYYDFKCALPVTCPPGLLVSHEDQDLMAKSTFPEKGQSVFGLKPQVKAKCYSEHKHSAKLLLSGEQKQIWGWAAKSKKGNRVTKGPGGATPGQVLAPGQLAQQGREKA